jgi:hypothetical protein
VANRRTSLDAHGLAGLKVDLTPTRSHDEPVVAVDASPQASPYASQAHTDAADPLVPYPIQLRLSQVQALKRLKSERGLVPAQLVRGWVTRGLAEVESAQ